MSISTSETRSSVMEDNMQSAFLNTSVPSNKHTLTTVSVHQERPHYQNERKDKTTRNEGTILLYKTEFSGSESEIKGIVNIESFPLEEQKIKALGSAPYFEHGKLHQNEEPVEFNLSKQMHILKVFPEEKHKHSNTSTCNKPFETFDDSFVNDVTTAMISNHNPDQQLRTSENETEERITLPNHERRTSSMDVLETSIGRKHAISSQLAESSGNKLYLVESEPTTERASDMSYDKIHQLLVKAVQEGKYKQRIVPIDIWDFGGQKDYYMTHQLFITSRGIFVLMFNGLIDLHKSMSDLNFLSGHFGKPTIAGTVTINRYFSYTADY